MIRPPVALVHGIWSSAAMWNSFAPYANSDARFYFHPVDYGTPLVFRQMEPDHLLHLPVMEPRWASGTTLPVS